MYYLNELCEWWIYTYNCWIFKFFWRKYWYSLYFRVRTCKWTLFSFLKKINDIIFISNFGSSFYLFIHLSIFLFEGGIKGGEENSKMDIKNQTISKASFSEGLHRLIRRIKTFSQFFSKLIYLPILFFPLKLLNLNFLF